MVNKNPKTKRIGKHYFRLSGQSQLYIKSQVLVNFTPIRKNKTNLNARSILPTFNNDQHFYTYSFRLPSTPVQNTEELLAEHNKRVAESTIEITEILYPKPRSKHKYCGVCRAHYEDYKEHVEGEEHLNCLKKSTYQLHIVQFCQKYQQSNSERREIDDTKNQQQSSEENVFKYASTESFDCSTIMKKYQLAVPLDA